MVRRVLLSISFQPLFTIRRGIYKLNPDDFVKLNECILSKLKKRTKLLAVVAELVRALYLIGVLYLYSKVKGSNPGFAD